MKYLQRAEPASESQTPEPVQVREQVERWEAVSTVCLASAVVLSVMSDSLSHHFAPRVGVSVSALHEVFTLVSLLWIGVWVYCSMRSKELLRLSRIEQLKRSARDEEEAARAEEYPGIRRH